MHGACADEVRAPLAASYACGSKSNLHILLSPMHLVPKLSCVSRPPGKGRNVHGDLCLVPHNIHILLQYVLCDAVPSRLLHFARIFTANRPLQSLISSGTVIAISPALILLFIQTFDHACTSRERSKNIQKNEVENGKEEEINKLAS